MNASIEKSLFSQIEIDHGPAGLLGRALLKAEAAARSRGISLTFAAMHELVRINDANRDTWVPLFTGFDPAFNALSPQNSFCILGRDSHGEVVATQAARLYDWPRSDYWREAESLRLLYDDPQRHRLNGERCEVSALAAKGIRGRVLYSGGAWYHPRHRGRGLVEILPRMARAIAYTRWKTDCTVTMMSEQNVRKGVFPRNGYRNIEWDVKFIGTRSGTIRFALLWLKSNEMLEDLETFLGSFELEVGARKLVANT
jgi:hypothetical protein